MIQMFKNKFAAGIAVVSAFVVCAMLLVDADAQLARQKKISQYVPPLKEQKLDYLVGAPQGNTSIRAKTLTATTTSRIVVFETEFGLRMKDASYVIQVTSNLASTLSLGAKAADRITIGDVQNGELLNVVIIGKVAGQP